MTLGPRLLALALLCLLGKAIGGSDGLYRILQGRRPPWREPRRIAFHFERRA